MSDTKIYVNPEPVEQVNQRANVEPNNVDIEGVKGSEYVDQNGEKRAPVYIPTKIEGSPKYDLRVIPVLLASLPPLLKYTGVYSLYLFAVGIISTFFLTLSVFLLVIYVKIFSHFLNFVTFLDILLLLDFFFLVFAGALYGAIHSSWFVKSGDILVEIFEKFVFGILPFCSVPLILTTVIEFAGVFNSSLWLCVIILIMVHLFGGPDEQSFSRVAKEQYFKPKYVQTRSGSAMLIFSLYVVPGVYYLITHWATFSVDVYHIVSILLLPAIANLFLLSNPDRYLWCFGQSFSNFFSGALRVLCVLVNCFMVWMWFCERVLLRRYPQILEHGPFPWNFVLLHCIACVVLIIFMYIAFAKTIPNAVFIFVFLFIGVSAPFVTYMLGFSMSAIFAGPAVIYMTCFLLRNKDVRPTWIQYISGSLLFALMMQFWLILHFSFLDYEFEFRLLPIEWTINMRHICWLISCCLLLSLLLVEVAKGQLCPPYLRGFLCLAQAVVFTILEEVFFEQGEGFYSPMYVLLTSALGLFYYTMVDERVSFIIKNVCIAIYVSKLVVLVNTSQSTKILLVLPLSFIVTRLYLLYVSTEYRNKKSYLKYPWVVVLSIPCAIVLASIVFLWDWLSDSDSSYTPSRYLGAGVFIWGCITILVTYVMSDGIETMRRLVLLLLSAGVIFGVIEPIFDLSGDKKDFFIPWLLFLALVYFVGLVLKIFMLPKSNLAKVFSFLFIALSLAISFSQIFLHYCFYHVDLLVAICFSLCALVIVTSHFSGRNKYGCLLIYYLFLFSCVLLVFTSMVYINPIKESNMFIPRYVLKERAFATCVAISFLLNLFICVLIKFKLDGNPLVLDSRTTRVNVETPEQVAPLATLLKVSCLVSIPIALFLTVLVKGGWTYVICSVFLLILYPSSYKYFIVLCIVQVIMIILCVHDLYSIVVQYLSQNHSFLVVIILDAAYACAFFCAFLPHLYVDYVFAYKTTPNMCAILLCLLISSSLAFIESMKSVRISGFMGMMEAFVLVAIYSMQRKN